MQGSKLTEKEIVELVAKNVDNPKQIRGGVIFLDNLPKNPQGKIQRKKLLEMLVWKKNHWKIYIYCIILVYSFRVNFFIIGKLGKKQHT